jgi:hypothetical protein
MIDFDTMRGAIVCGGRRYGEDNERERARVFYVLDQAVIRLKLQYIIQGASSGADFMAWQWAQGRNFPCGSFPADWTQYGKRAGYIRNQKMLDEAKPVCTIAFPGDAGTRMMCLLSEKAGVPVYRIDW